MVNSEKVEVMGLELAPTFGANPTMKPEGFFPVIFPCLCFGFHFPDKGIDLFGGFSSRRFYGSSGPAGFKGAGHL
jgi:hypothetical protein